MKILFVLFILAIIPTNFGYIEGQCGPDVVGECKDDIEEHIETRSPYLQQKHGIPPSEVMCLGDRELIIKNSNGKSCLYLS